jgi:hypothetical protein
MRQTEASIVQSRRGVKTALVVAHPGHELRLATWVGRIQPVVFIIAKGARSGRSEARIQASRALVLELGGTPAEPFGLAFDAEIYGWIMTGDITMFARVADDLRDAFVAQGTTTVVTDSWQNYNPVHDLTHALARVAAAEAAARLGRRVEVLDYPVVPHALAHAEIGSEHSRIALSAAEVATKMALAAQFPEIVEDVRLLSETAGRGAFDVESLHHPKGLRSLMCTPGHPPLYELYGEERVKRGVYADVLRWSHMEPIVTMLANRLARAESASNKARFGPFAVPGPPSPI